MLGSFSYYSLKCYCIDIPTNTNDILLYAVLQYSIYSNDTYRKLYAGENYTELT